jgi:hypothetical protein
VDQKLKGCVDITFMNCKILKQDGIFVYYLFILYVTIQEFKEVRLRADFVVRIIF